METVSGSDTTSSSTPLLQVGPCCPDRGVLGEVVVRGEQLDLGSVEGVARGGGDRENETILNHMHTYSQSYTYSRQVEHNICNKRRGEGVM